MYQVKFTDVAQREVKGNKRTVRLRKGRLVLVITFLLFLALDLILITEYKTRGANAVSYQFMERVADAFDSGTNLVTSIWEPQLKQEDNLTSVLIIGVDTRNAEFDGEEFVNTVDPGTRNSDINTDVIIQLIYNHDTGEIFMISIPRDMGVDVREECLEFHGSLHWVFDKGQSANCPGGGIQTLSKTVENITGVPVHYYGMVSFDIFIDVIDTVGETNDQGEKGIWIDIPEPVYELYPIEGAGWESVYFPAGHQFLTSTDALKFARSRKASSDFARARRQQMVISAVKDRVISSDTLMNPKKIYEIYKIFKEKALISDVTLDEIRAGLNIVRDLDETEIIHLVLDPEFGGHEVFLNKQPHNRPGGPYYMVPTHWQECPENEFCRVQEFIKEIMEDPGVYGEEARIFVYARTKDYSGNPNFSNQTYQDFINAGVPLELTESKYLANISDDSSIVIYDFTNGSKPDTVELLERELGVTAIPGDQAPSNVRINNDEIAIVVKAD